MNQYEMDRCIDLHREQVAFEARMGVEERYRTPLSEFIEVRSEGAARKEVEAIQGRLDDEKDDAERARNERDAVEARMAALRDRFGVAKKALEDIEASPDQAGTIAMAALAEITSAQKERAA